MLRTSQKSVPLTYSMAEWLFQSRRWLLPRCSRDLKDSCCLHHVILSHKDLDTNIPKFKVRWLHYTKFVYIMSGCWFQTFFIFPYIGNVIIPIDELIFFKMVIAPPTRCYHIVIIFYDMCFISIIYPLVNVYITMENHHVIAGKTHYFYGHFQ